MKCGVEVLIREGRLDEFPPQLFVNPGPTSQSLRFVRSLSPTFSQSEFLDRECRASRRRLSHPLGVTLLPSSSVTMKTTIAVAATLLALASALTTNVSAAPYHYFSIRDVSTPSSMNSTSPSGTTSANPFGVAYTDRTCKQGAMSLQSNRAGGLLSEKYHAFKPSMEGVVACTDDKCSENCKKVEKDSCYASPDPKNLCLDFRKVSNPSGSK